MHTYRESNRTRGPDVGSASRMSLSSVASSAPLLVEESPQSGSKSKSWLRSHGLPDNTSFKHICIYAQHPQCKKQLIQNSRAIHTRDNVNILDTQQQCFRSSPRRCHTSELSDSKTNAMQKEANTANGKAQQHTRKEIVFLFYKHTHEPCSRHKHRRDQRHPPPLTHPPSHRPTHFSFPKHTATHATYTKRTHLCQNESMHNNRRRPSSHAVSYTR